MLFERLSPYYLNTQHNKKKRAGSSRGVPALSINGKNTSIVVPKLNFNSSELYHNIYIFFKKKLTYVIKIFSKKKMGGKRKRGSHIEISNQSSNILREGAERDLKNRKSVNINIAIIKKGFIFALHLEWRVEYILTGVFVHFFFSFL